MPKFFVNKENIGDGSVTITEPDSRHIARSLRMAVGDYVTISDGEGIDYKCRLCRIRDEECLAEIIEMGASVAESPVKITLFMAMPKGDKLETVVQKAVELGAVMVIPFESERCIKRPTQDKLEKIAIRLTRIAIEAAKQCGRSVLPSVAPMIRFDDMLARLPEYDLSIFCYEGEREKSIKDVLEHQRDAKTISVIIGSEGGFSIAEAERIITSGATPITLGRRILRCETAPDYALSVLSYHYEL